MTSKKIKSSLSRRKVLTRAAAGAAALTVPGPYIIKARAQSGLKIGLIVNKTGPGTEQGKANQDGVMLYVESVGSKLLGQPLEVVWLDEPDVQSAQVNAQKLIDDKCIALIGAGNSASGLAIASVAARNKIPYMAINPAARELTGANCNKYTFRVLSTVPANSRALTPYLNKSGKKWYLLTASYAFGQDIKRTMEEIAKANGAEIVGNDQTPLGTTDFSSFMLKIRAAQPTCIALGIPSTDFPAMFKQYAEFGLNRIPVLTPGVSDTDVWAAGPDVLASLSGAIFGGKHFWYKDPNMLPDEKAMAEAYTKKYNKPTADKVWMGWYCMKVLMLGIEAAKSTNSGKIVTALENLKLPGARGMSASFRKFDHQMARPLMIAQIKSKITDPYDVFDILDTVPEKESDLEALHGTEEQVGCKMGPL